jgi:hypothetical protein
MAAVASVWAAVPIGRPAQQATLRRTLRLSTEWLSLTGDEAVQFTSLWAGLPRAEHVTPFEHDVRASAGDDVTATNLTGQDEVAMVAGMPVL